MIYLRELPYNIRKIRQQVNIQYKKWKIISNILFFLRKYVLTQIYNSEFCYCLEYNVQKIAI